MKTEYQYIRMVKTADKPKTSVWRILSISGDVPIGTIRWHPPRRQYCFFPYDLTVFSNGCLEDICNFIKELKAGAP